MMLEEDLVDADGGRWGQYVYLVVPDVVACEPVTAGEEGYPAYVDVVSLVQQQQM